MRDTLLTHKGSELGALAYKPRLLLLEVPLLLRRLSCPDSAWYAQMQCRREVIFGLELSTTVV